MTELLNLGELYVSDFIREVEEPRGGKVEMKLILDKYGEVRLEKTANLDTMYGKYWYRSGINATMKRELSDIVTSITTVFDTKDGDVWLDIACNDGTLLDHTPSYMYRVGVDPADDSFKEESEKVADVIIQDYFTRDEYIKEVNKKAKVITSIAVFYDIEDRDSFLKDVYDVMDDNGLWVLQLSYTPLMIHQLAFDNICHEHTYYYSLFNLKELFKDNGFKIMDCQLNDINGGSFRVYVMKDVGDERLFSSQPHRDVCSFRIRSLLSLEDSLFLDNPSTWKTFNTQIDKLKEETVLFIKSVTATGKVVMGYGASTKGNTLLQYFGLNDSLITAIADRNPQKWGLRTVGTGIPIISEQEMREAQPDYLLVLPWHFINEFKKRESEYIRKGGKFIVPCPQFKIIE